MTRTTFQILITSIIPALVFMCFVGTVHANEEQLRDLQGQYVFTYDHLTLPEQEKMGLLGGSYLLRPNRHFSFGLGVYGAVYGERGGFFTGGFESGLHYSLPGNLYFDSGLFVGGGGGGAAPQGGGLMLRPHIDIGYRPGSKSGMGIGLSRVWFPNGEIVSDQITLHIKRQFSTLLLPRGASRKSAGENASGLTSYARLFAPQLNAYFPDRGTPGRDGFSLDERMDVVGIRWRENLSGAWWGDFETGGAWGGGVDGFAQVFVGGGYELTLTNGLSLIGGAQLGAAGGGDVHTGGGLLGRLNLAALIKLYQNWHLVLEGGRIHAFDGEFKGWVMTSGLAYRYQIMRRESSAGTKNLELNQLQWADFRLRAGVQRYARYFQGNGRKNTALEHIPVDQVHLKIDSFFNQYLFFSGQALAAYDGQAGGYAVGLVGSGLRLPLMHRIYASAEMLVGAAGGGGIAVGGGMIAQPMAAIGWRLSESWGLEAGAGYIYATAGELRALVLDLGFSYEFSVPHGG